MIGADPPSRLDKALARDVPEAAHLSRSRLARLIADGAVLRAGQAVPDGKARVAEGEVFEIHLEPAADVDIAPEAIPLEILHEDPDLAVVLKPAGMVVHPAPGNPNGTLVNALLHHFGENISGVGGEKRPGIVHRIDKETSGLWWSLNPTPRITGLRISSRPTRLNGSTGRSATGCPTWGTRVCGAYGA